MSSTNFFYSINLSSTIYVPINLITSVFLSTCSFKRLSERLALGSVAKSGSRWRQRLERRPGSHELENSCLACFSPSHPSPSLCQCPAAQNIDMIKETASRNGAKVTEWFPSAPPLVMIWICRALYEDLFQLPSWNFFCHKVGNLYKGGSKNN